MHTQKKTMKNIGLKKRIASTVLALTLVLGMIMSTVPVGLTDGTATIVEAASKKKDKKKPVIKMSGKSKMTVTKGVSVKIPKVTAKDNKDGNVTKKIKITVKKGKKSYSSIAKKIKNNKKVKFTATGKYTITYTVKDKAGNKATKKRYVTVKKKEKTTEQSTTQENEDMTAEEEVIPPITAESLVHDTYNISTDADFHKSVIEVPTSSDNITISIENNRNLIFDPRDNLTDKSVFLGYFGKITATDAEGNDISDKIIIDEYNLVGKTHGQDAVIYIYVNDGKGNEVIKKKIISLQLLYDGVTFPGYELISTDPMIFAKIYTNTVETVGDSAYKSE